MIVTWVAIPTSSSQSNASARKVRPVAVWFLFRVAVTSDALAGSPVRYLNPPTYSTCSVDMFCCSLCVYTLARPPIVCCWWSPLGGVILNAFCLPRCVRSEVPSPQPPAKSAAGSSKLLSIGPGDSICACCMHRQCSKPISFGHGRVDGRLRPPAEQPDATVEFGIDAFVGRGSLANTPPPGGVFLTYARHCTFWHRLVQVGASPGRCQACSKPQTIPHSVAPFTFKFKTTSLSMQSAVLACGTEGSSESGNLCARPVSGRPIHIRFGARRSRPGVMSSLIRICVLLRLHLFNT
jgi:hypothetical protein